MYTVVYHILNTNSHFNSTIKIANYLRSKGYSITYFALENVKQKVLDNGFNFFSFPSNHFTYNNRYRGSNYIKRTIRKYKNNRKFESNFLKGDFYDQLINQISPDLILVDLSLVNYSIFLIKKRVLFLTFCTKVNLNKSEISPPFIYRVIPVSNLLFLYYNKLLWYLFFQRRNLFLFINRFFLFRISHFSLVIRYSKENNIDFLRISNRRRCSHFGWEHHPELILSPKEFDFPREFSPNQTCIGPVVDLKRDESNNEIFNNSLYFKLINNNNSNQKIIFCSMGSYDFKYAKHRVLFFIQLIKILEKRNDLFLIISTGFDINPNAFKIRTKNILLYREFPQIEILKNADLMITHGGMQSVTECIMLEVPMLVYPLNPYLDQNGNSARVVYHKIGLKGKLKKDKAKMIEIKIDEMLTNIAYFLNNIRKLREKIVSSEDFEKGMEFIENYIEETNHSK